MSPHVAGGHPGRYKECRQPDCLAYRRRYQKRYTYERSQGRTRIVDATEAGRHVLTLLGKDWSVRAIAGAAHTSPAVICRLRDGQARANRVTVAAILAIDPDIVPSEPTTQTTEPFVPALGARRRLQALLWMGWGWDQIKARTDIGNPAATLHQQGRWVTRSTHDKIAALYDELAMTPGPSSKARTWARKLGYAPPLAWDDIDSDSAPSYDATGEHLDAVDDITVARLLAGDPVPCTAAEKREALRRWLATGRSERSLCLIHGWKEGRYTTDAEEAAS